MTFLTSNFFSSLCSACRQHDQVGPLPHSIWLQRHLLRWQPQPIPHQRGQPEPLTHQWGPPQPLTHRRPPACTRPHGDHGDNQQQHYGPGHAQVRRSVLLKCRVCPPPNLPPLSFTLPLPRFLISAALPLTINPPQDWMPCVWLDPQLTPTTLQDAEESLYAKEFLFYFILFYFVLFCNGLLSLLALS